jgi:predicted MPP superfamily phosphohydrolase
MTQAQFIDAWHAAGGSPQTMAEQTGMAIRGIYARRLRLEKDGVFLSTNPRAITNAPYSPPAHFERWRKFKIKDGVVVVFSDPHYLPDHSTVGHDALETVVAREKPVLIVLNGDAVDGDTISRYDPTRGHHKRFTVREELDCVKLHLESLQKVAGKTQLAWPLGNHDVRLSRHIAVKTPELLDMPMTRLEDWFPAWPLSWAVMVNEGTPGHTVIRHRNQAGMLHMQAQKAGAHYVHGHLHNLNVHRFPTFAGVRYSVDTGSLADPDSEGFDYTEGNKPHAQGFAVLTYRDWKLLPPELGEVVDGVAYFRGAPV